MKIIFVLFLLFAAVSLVAIRYRKQITGMIGFARALKDANEAAGNSSVMPPATQPGIQLVNCAKCGVWVPQDKATKVRQGYYCSNCH